MNVLTTVTFPNVSAIVAEEVVNTFSWTVDTLAHLQAFTTAGIPAFYNSAFDAANPLAFAMSPELSRAANAVTIKYFDVTAHLDGSPHGSPVAVEQFTLGAAGGQNPLPAQCAAVIGFHGAFGALLERGAADAAIPSDEEARDEGAPAVHAGFDRPKSRVRGRVFIGPLTTQAQNAADPDLLNPVFLDSCEAAIESFLAAVGANFSVWSRRNATMVTATNFQIDNAFRTIRRRVIKPTLRRVG